MAMRTCDGLQNRVCLNLDMSISFKTSEIILIFWSLIPINSGGILNSLMSSSLMIVWLLFIIVLMGLFCLPFKKLLISTVVLPTQKL